MLAVDDLVPVVKLSPPPIILKYTSLIGVVHTTPCGKTKSHNEIDTE